VACTPGRYCASAGLSLPTGLCAAGYVCVNGSSAQQPGSGTSVIATPTQSGACPAGHYCPAATEYYIPCAPGTYQPSTGQSSCLSCPAGRYCADSGRSEAATSLPSCDDGFECKGGADNPKPNDGGTGGLCPVGHQCTVGTATACAAGTYASVTGLSACTTCPLGHYCAAGSSTPTACASEKYCPAGSADVTDATAGTSGPQDCPAGTLALSSARSVESPSQCKPCTAGMYCDGTVGSNKATGFCDAGYYCVAGAGSAASDDFKCPAGFYCLAGTTRPTACADGTYSQAGAATSSDCKACAAGQHCLQGTSVSVDCPAGHYCPAGADSPVPCPKQTYSTRTGRDEPADCRACPAGALCSETGISALDAFFCPPGYYCEQKTFTTDDGRELKAATEATACPVGSYRAYRAGKSVADCPSCPPGSYCPSVATATPLLCPNGTFCTGGNSAPAPCDKGFYCPAGEASPQLCPAGFSCGGASEFYAKCQNGTYCPPGSPNPIPCPGGTFGSGNTRNYDKESGCIGCGRGMYSTEYSDGNCFDCTPGYVCLGETSTATPTIERDHKGYECPKGHYCPAASYKEVPCGKGAYSKRLGGTSTASCVRCKVGWYNDLTG